MATAPRLSQTSLAVELDRSLAVIDDATAGAGIDVPARAVARRRAESLFPAESTSPPTRHWPAG
jgi:hypothetical protein